MIEIIKNPIIIGITVGVLVYIYIQWEQQNKKNKKDNLMLPLGIGILAWFLPHNYFQDYNFEMEDEVHIPTIRIISPQLGGSKNTQQLQILKKGVSLPDNLEIPDMLLDNF